MRNFRPRFVDLLRIGFRRVSRGPKCRDLHTNPKFPRAVKLLGCVNSTPDFTDQHLVINGASDLIHEIFGKSGDGFHARSAVGFVSLPTGVAVEVEAIFELKA